MKLRQVIPQSCGCAVVLALILVAGTSVSTTATPGCACVTWNGIVLGDLDHLSADIEAYVVQNGRYPTFAEVAEMLPPEDYHQRLLTDEIEVVQTPLRFLRFTNNAAQIGYAVSPDRTQGILIGMGISEERGRLYLFGHLIQEWLTGELLFPILLPGQAEPPDGAAA